MKSQNHRAFSEPAVRPNRGFSLYLLLALAVAGCSASKDGPGAGPDPLGTKAGFCRAWATHACNATVVDRCQAPSVDDCINSQQLFCQSALPSGYQSTNAQACLDRVKAAYSDGVLSGEDIDVVLHLGAPCDQLVRGPSSEAGSCTRHTDCDTLNEQTCVIKPGASEGACHEPVVVGGGRACDAPDEVCEDGFYCKDSQNCIEQLGAGEACGSDAECGADLRCVPGETADAGAPAGTCEARKAPSAVCTINAECASNYCSIGRGEVEGLCANSIQLAQREPICEDLR